MAPRPNPIVKKVSIIDGAYHGSVPKSVNLRKMLFKVVPFDYY
jgi:hypothetical protein